MSSPTSQPTATSATDSEAAASSDSSTEDTPVEPTVELYQKTVLGAAIKAANLLDELIGISIIPDPRVKDAADIALKLVALMNEQIARDAAGGDEALTTKRTKRGSGK